MAITLIYSNLIKKNFVIPFYNSIFAIPKQEILSVDCKSKFENIYDQVGS